MANHNIDDILNDLGLLGDDLGQTRRAPKREPDEGPPVPNVDSDAVEDTAVGTPPGKGDAKHSEKKQKRPGRSAKQAESFSPLPPMPSGQRMYGENGRQVDDPAVPEGAGNGPVQSVGKAVNEIYQPDADGDEIEATGLEQVLLEHEAATGETLSSALNVLKQSPGKRLADILIEQGADEEAVQRCVAEHAGLQFERIDVEAGLEGGYDGRMLQRLTAEFAKQHHVLPLRTEGSRVVVGATTPDDVVLLDDIRDRLGGQPIKLVIVTSADVRTALDATGEGAEDEDVDLSEILADVDESDVEVSESEQGEAVDLEQQAGESPVIRYVNYIIQTAVKEGASDIHIEPAEKKVKVRFRIDGVLFEMMNPPASMGAAITSRLKIMANLDISERRVPQDGRIRCAVQGRKLDLRMSTIPTASGEKTVMRILDTRSINVQLEELGFEEGTLETWRNQVKSPHGIVLVTGPTGSGKTTTLYSSLRQIDKNKLNVSTVEDPIEYHLDGITQTQTHEKIGMTFARALRALLRQDPDVIMLGEIRDHETAHIAVQAALTGHLVLSTLHTNDAPSSVTRLVNIGLEPFLVGAAVNGVLAQRLVRRLCPACKHEVEPSEEMAEFLTMQGFDASKMWASQGCDRCRNTGFAGRVGIYEMLVIDDQTRDIVARNPNVAEFRRLCIERGMRTLRMDGLEKVRTGLTTVQEILRVTEASV